MRRAERSARIRRGAAAATWVLALGLAGGPAGAVDGVLSDSPGRIRLDPGIPPALRADAPPETRRRALEARRAASPTTGAALAAQVERTLRESFDAADRAHRGALTREEAAAGGFGFIARHFDAIDTRRAGEVRFEDLQRYLRDRAAATKPEVR